MSDILKNVPRETIERLEKYEELLLKWQEKINLIGEPNHVWERHFLDSAQLYQHLPDKNASLLDMGTGAGFPGMVLAIMGMHNVYLAESDTRKSVFLKEVARETRTVVTLHRDRLENLEGAFDIVTARALAPLTELIAYAFKLLKPSSFCLFPKGRNYSIELDQAHRDWTFDAEILPSELHEDGVILIIRNLERKHG